MNRPIYIDDLDIVIDELRKLSAIYGSGYSNPYDQVRADTLQDVIHSLKYLQNKVKEEVE